MDFMIDIGFTVLLRVLKDKAQSKKLRSAFFKLFVAIGTAFDGDESFMQWAYFYGEKGK